MFETFNLWVLKNSQINHYEDTKNPNNLFYHNM